MSGRLVSFVFDSALPAWLKPYAAVYASFAAEDGSRVYPSIARVARMVSRSERATQTATTELRRRGVLVVERPRARDRSTRYSFNTAALTWIRDNGQFELFPQGVVPNPGAKTPNAEDFHRYPQQLTGSPLPPRGEVGFTRSVSDPSVRTSIKAQTKKTRTA